MPLAIMIMGPSRPWSDRYLFSAFNASQQLSIRFNTLQRHSTLGGLAVLKPVEPLSAVTFRTSLEGRSTRSVGREPQGVKRSVRVHFGVIKEVVDDVELHQRAVEQHLEALRTGKTSLLISPRHEEARKVAALVRQKLKAEGAIGAEEHAVTVLRRMDLGSEACRDLLHYAPGRVIGFHSRTAGGFRPGEKWTVKETNCETVTLESHGKVRQFKPSAKGKWDVLVSSTMQVSVGDQIRVTAGFREGKNVFKNNDIAQVREITDTELVLNDGRRMRRNGARIDQGVCITSHASQCRTVDQVVVLPDGADAKGWYVSLSRARDWMHVHTRDKAALRQSVMYPGERKSVSVGAYQSFAKVRATIQESNDARPLGDAPSRNSSRDWNGTLAAYCHVTLVEQNQSENQKDTVSGMALPKR
jgi:hypothetical protein